MLIREINNDEIDLIKVFLYEAIFVSDPNVVVPKNIIENPELKIYYENWGLKDDNCLVAVVDNKVVGAVFSRIMNDYGHINDYTPSLGISVYKEYRGLGIGTKLLDEMIKLLKKKGYKNLSLSVQKKNYALKMYNKLGFRIIDSNKEEYIMVCDL